MFGGKSRRSEWGIEGFNLVSKAHSVFTAIDNLVNTSQPVELETISKFVPLLEEIHNKNIGYSSKWQPIVREDSKNGGSFTLLFGAVHAIEASSQAIWACYVIGSVDFGSEVSKNGLLVYRELAENCYGNAKGLLRFDFKMTQTRGAEWFAQTFPIYTTSELLAEIHTIAMTRSEIPSAWFPSL